MVRERLTAPIFIRSIPTIIHQVTEPQVLHTCFGVYAVEVRVLRTVGCWGGHRAVVERDIVQSRDPIEHAQADLRQGDLEGLGQTPQLDGGLVPLWPLVVQRPPEDGIVWVSFNLKVHICSPHRYAGVVMPVRDDRQVFAVSPLTENYHKPLTTAKL